jgi:hypothetical protein
MRENGRNGLRAKILEALRPTVAAFAVENVVDNGTPDVHCTFGWIELKVGVIPIRASTRVNFGMLPTQRVWHTRWREFGGRSWTLCRLEDQSDDLVAIMMHDGHWSAGQLDSATVAELQASSLAWWTHSPTGEELIAVLAKPLPRIRR